MATPVSKLPGKGVTVSIADMGVQNGVPTSPGTATVLTALLRNIEVAKTMDEVDMTALTDDLKFTQVTHESDEATLEFLVPQTGVQLAGLIGHYVQMQWKELATLSPKTFLGVVTAHKWSASEAQVENITIKGGAN